MKWCVVCEVQQSSNVTYRVYDYNRRDANGELRPLHMEKALDVIYFGAFQDRTCGGAIRQTAGGTLRKLTACQYFSCYELQLKGAFRRKRENSFLAVNVIEGKGTLNDQAFVGGDSFFLACGEEARLQGNGKMIITEFPE